MLKVRKTFALQVFVKNDANDVSGRYSNKQKWVLCGGDVAFLCEIGDERSNAVRVESHAEESKWIEYEIDYWTDLFIVHNLKIGC